MPATECYYYAICSRSLFIEANNVGTFSLSQVNGVSDATWGADNMKTLLAKPCTLKFGIVIGYNRK